MRHLSLVLALTAACSSGSAPPAATDVPAAPVAFDGQVEEPAPVPASAVPPLEPRDELAPLLTAEGFTGAFVAWEAGAARGVCVGGAACEARYPPASTFKVPQALIALDLGVLSGPEHELAWDGVRRPIAAWNRDHTLRSAIRESTVWYFQRVAPLIGRERMQAALERFGYGNLVIGGELDAFWLDGSLRVSAVEQVHFWHRLHAGELGAGAQARAHVLEMTELRRAGDRVLRGKTGWHRRTRHTNRGWLAGCLDGPTRVCFATVLAADEPFDHGAFLRARLDASVRLLQALGYAVP